MSSRTIQECLSVVGVTAADFDGCDTLEEEFNKIKKIYHKKILKVHPDKGGDAAVFRSVRTSFESLKKQYENNRIQSFASEGRASAEFYEATDNHYNDMPTPSWEFYQAAAQEEMPPYRVEKAKSRHSKCRQESSKYRKCSSSGRKIEQGALRCGSLDGEAGQYTRWHHLECWRVPAVVHLGLPDPSIFQDPKAFEDALLQMNSVTLSGFAELEDESKALVVAHVMDVKNWAKSSKPPRALSSNESATSAAAAAAGSKKKLAKSNSKEVISLSPSLSESRALIARGNDERNKFIIPKPGKNGPADSMAGKRFCLTGVFPEVGGGGGLNLGKAKVKAMIESFGGRVTSSVSGLTDYLVVGKDPGMSKVCTAEARGVKKVTITDLRFALEGETAALQNAGEVAITSFSSGYNGNGIAGRLAGPETYAAIENGPPNVASGKKRAAGSKVARGKKKRSDFN